jgi:hypothetical protein
MPLFKNWAPNFLNKKRKRDLFLGLGVPTLKPLTAFLMQAENLILQTNTIFFYA